MSQHKHTDGTDMISERPDGTQGASESPKAPAEALRQQYNDFEKKYRNRFNSNDNFMVDLGVLEAFVTAYAATVEREARLNEIKGCQKHVLELRTSVPRLQQTPPQMDEYYRTRLAALQGPLDVKT